MQGPYKSVGVFVPRLQLSNKEDGGLRYHITIPSSLIRLLPWKKGTELSILPGREERTLVIREMPPKVVDTE